VLKEFTPYKDPFVFLFFKEKTSFPINVWSHFHLKKEKEVKTQRSKILMHNPDELCYHYSLVYQVCVIFNIFLKHFYSPLVSLVRML